jgi:F0F1-type ATP synthase assembly protein I
MAMNLSWTMLFSLLLPLLAGLWLDKKLDTSPLFLLIGVGLGILAATVGVARMVLRIFPTAGTEDPDQQEIEAEGKEEPE